MIDRSQVFFIRRMTENALSCVALLIVALQVKRTIDNGLCNNNWEKLT